MRKVSAPYCFIIVSGFITFPFDFDILTPPSPKTIPCEVLFLYGSEPTTVGTAFISHRNLKINLEYNKCKVVCSIPPLYQSTGIQYLRAPWLAIAVLFFGSVYLK